MSDQGATNRATPVAASRRNGNADKYASLGANRERGFTLIELLVVIAIIGLLVGLLLPAIQAARESSRRNACANNLHQIGTAIHAYESLRKHWPPGGNEHKLEQNLGISWRVMILPQLEQNALYDRIGPNTLGGATSTTSRNVVIEVFRCPSAAPPLTGPTAYFESNYSGVAGAGRDGHRRVLEHNICGDLFTDGVMPVQRLGTTVKTADIEDGTSKTLAVGERNYTWRDWMSGAVWTKITPLQVCTGSATNMEYPINSGGYFKQDNSVDVSLRTLLLNDLYFGSNHPGGAQFCFADGSVHMMADSTDITILQDMATIAGAEIIRGQL